MPGEKVWYIAAKDGRRGPYSFEELQEIARTGGIAKTDLVWSPVFGQDWMRAEQVDGIFPPERTEEEIDEELEREHQREHRRRSEEEILEEFFNETPRPRRRYNRREPPSGPDPFLETIVPLAGVDGYTPLVWTSAKIALKRTLLVLFKPFDLVRWLSLGFFAWLCKVGTGIGANIQLPAELSGGNMASLSPEQFASAVKTSFDTNLLKAMHFVQQPGGMTQIYLWGGCFALLWFTMCWLRCRADFAFLHSWYRPSSPLLATWKRFAWAGRDLFWWRGYIHLMAALVGFIIYMNLYRDVLVPYAADGCVWQAAFAGHVGKAVWSVAMLFFVACSLCAISRDFVAPVMYWQGTSATRAWLAFFSILRQFPFRVTGFYLAGGLFRALWMALYATLAACSLGILAVPLALPFAGAVLMLPVDYFFRGYSIYFLSQWRNDLVSDE